MVLLQQQQSAVPKVMRPQGHGDGGRAEVLPPLVHWTLPLPKPWATVPLEQPRHQMKRGPEVVPGRQVWLALPEPSPLGSVPGGTRGFLSLLGDKGELRKEAQGRGICNIRAKFSPRIETRRIRDVSQAL